MKIKPTEYKLNKISQSLRLGYGQKEIGLRDFDGMQDFIETLRALNPAVRVGSGSM